MFHGNRVTIDTKVGYIKRTVGFDFRVTRQERVGLILLLFMSFTKPLVRLQYGAMPYYCLLDDIINIIFICIFSYV